MMDMQYGLLARQRHHERIEHALGPRPERYGPPSPRPTQRSFAPLSYARYVLTALSTIGFFGATLTN
jgi:hypothetical protein